jgi:hypothetical protein
MGCVGEYLGGVLHGSVARLLYLKRVAGGEECERRVFGAISRRKLDIRIARPSDAF